MELTSSHKHVKNTSTNGTVLKGHLLNIKTSNSWKDEKNLHIATSGERKIKGGSRIGLVPLKESWKNINFSRSGKLPQPVG